RERELAFRRLEQISPRDLSNDQQIDRLALRSQLLKESEDHDRGRHTLEPNAPEQLFHILLHELQRGDDEPRRAARNLRSLLKQAPDFLEQAAEVIQRPERVWLRVMEQTIAGSPALLKGIEQFLKTAEAREDDKILIRATERALNEYKTRVSRRRSAPSGSFAVGAERLQRRVRDELGL